MENIYLLLKESLGPWLMGLLFSLGIGHMAVLVFLTRLRNYMNLGPKSGEKSVTEAVPSWLMGVGERLFFTIAVGVNLSGAGVAMMVWLTLKLAANWNRPGRLNAREGLDDEERELLLVRWALSAALAGLLSMTFALIGGLIVQWYKLAWAVGG